MAELQESLLQQEGEQREVESLTAPRLRSSSTPEKTIIHAFSIEGADGQGCSGLGESRRRERHVVTRFSRAFGEAFRLVLRHHRATLLWFTVMSINTFASAFGALADETRLDCSIGDNLTTSANTSVPLVPNVDVTQPSSCSSEDGGMNTATPGSQAVFGITLILFVCIGVVTIVLSTCIEEGKGVGDWVKAHFVDVMVVLSGTVYLAGANLSLVASLNLNLFMVIGDTCTTQSPEVRNIRNYLIALAFLISIIPDAFKKYWNVLLIEEDCGSSVANIGKSSDVVENAANGVKLDSLSTHHRPKSKKPKLHYLILQGLFQMLSYMVHLDELYIIIQDEVSSCDDDEEGRSCLAGFVKAGIVSYVIVSLLWVGISSVLVCKYAHDLDTVKIKRRQRKRVLGTNEVYNLQQRTIELCWTRKHLGLFLFWLVLAMYIPTYLALNNTWPWICVTRCQLQPCDSSSDGREERCAHYFNTRITLLFLFGIGTVALLLVYFCVVLWKETDREEEEGEKVTDACPPVLQDTEEAGSHHELAVNSSQSQSQEIE